MRTRSIELPGIDRPVIQGGMVVGLIHDIPTCQELLDRIMAEAEEIICRRLAGMPPA